jgi:thiaminase (transcriptional activator TenA)
MLPRRSLAGLGVAAFAAPGPRLRDELWNASLAVYAAILKHPFLTGLNDGRLLQERFRFYLEQDSLYLVAFAEALSVLASKAPRVDWMSTLNQHALDCVKTEKQLHDAILRGSASTQMAPTNYAYTNHLLATVHRKSFGEGLAALLPCYWIYWEVGKELKKRGSKNADYQKWIDQYADASYGKTVETVLGMMDTEAGVLSPAQRRACVDLFLTGSRYEYQFWDMAWRMESWTP